MDAAIGRRRDATSFVQKTDTENARVMMRAAPAQGSRARYQKNVLAFFFMIVSSACVLQALPAKP